MFWLSDPRISTHRDFRTVLQSKTLKVGDGVLLKCKEGALHVFKTTEIRLYDGGRYQYTAVKCLDPRLGHTVFIGDNDIAGTCSV